MPSLFGTDGKGFSLFRTECLIFQMDYLLFRWDGEEKCDMVVLLNERKPIILRLRGHNFNVASVKCFRISLLSSYSVE